MSDATRDDVDPLLEGWLDGTLDEADERRLGEILAADPNVATRLARATLVHDRLRDLLRDADPHAVVPTPRPRRWRGAWLALPAALLAAVVVAAILVQTPEATASATLERMARASGVGVREYVVHVVDHGPGGPVVVDSEAGGRKPGVDGARLWVGGSDRFVLVRSFADGSRFVDGCDGRVGWSVPPTGHVHLSRDTARFRRGIPGESADVPFIALPENLLRLGRGYDLHLGETLEDGSRLLVAVRRASRRQGPSRVTIRFAADGTPLAIDLEGLRGGIGRDGRPDATADGPERVSLELVSRGGREAGFFAHDHHHAPDRPLDWE